MPSLQSDTAPANTSPLVKLAVWLVATLAVMVYGPLFVSAFVPPAGGYMDFVQEWLSARNYWAGDPVYFPQREAMLRRTGRDMPGFDSGLPWNAHPPASLLIALPFGLFDDYRTAHLAWNLATFPLLFLSLALIARELPGGWPRWAVIPAVALFLTSTPVRSQIFQGQVNFVLLFLLTVAWVADRRGRPLAAGCAVGTAAAMKLFPGLLLLYFLATGRWRAAVVAGIVGIGWNVVALALFGSDAFITYVRDILPSLDMYRMWRTNISPKGYWARLGALVGEPRIAHLTVACQSLVVGTVAWAGWMARTKGDRDRAFSLAIAAMPLASPVAWEHYCVFLTLPALVMWSRARSGVVRWGLLAAAAMVWPSEVLLAKWVIGAEAASALPDVVPPPHDYGLCLLAIGAGTYALATLFVLLAFTRPKLDEPAA